MKLMLCKQLKIFEFKTEMTFTVSVCCQAHLPLINEGKKKGDLLCPRTEKVQLLTLQLSSLRTWQKNSPVVCQDTCLPKACKCKFYCLGRYLILFIVLSQGHCHTQKSNCSILTCKWLSKMQEFFQYLKHF